MEDGPIAVHDAHDTHVVEGNELADRRRDPVEDVLEMQGLRGNLGDLGKDVRYRLRVDGRGSQGHDLLLDAAVTRELLVLMRPVPPGNRFFSVGEVLRPRLGAALHWLTRAGSREMRLRSWKPATCVALKPRELASSYTDCRLPTTQARPCVFTMLARS